MLHNLNINKDSRLEVNNYSSTANYWLYTAKTKFLHVILNHLLPFFYHLFHVKSFYIFISYVHRNISMRILECPPSDKQGYLDEADKFYLNPSAWLTKQFGDQTEHRDQIGLPSHIVMYNVLLPVRHLTVL